MTVYRTKPDTDALASSPRELVYDAVDRASSQSSAVVLFRIVGLPVLVAMVLSIFLDPRTVAVGIVVAFAYGIWANRRKHERAKLRIDGGRLLVERKASKPKELLLAALRNVELDIKKIRRVQEGGAIPDVRFVNSTVGPEVDTARIVLVTDAGRIWLSDAYLAHIDAVESLGKIRVFLRESGWTPEDERPSIDEEDDSDDANDGSRSP